MDPKREKHNVHETPPIYALSKESRSILIVGNWHWDIYEEALAAGFRKYGWTVIPFNFDKHLSNSILTSFLVRGRVRTAIARLNNSLIRTFLNTLPTSVFFYRSDLILPDSLRLMKKIRPETVLILFHNDNPFIGLINRIKMRHYLASISIADITLVYRPSNLRDAQQYNARELQLFLPHYLSYRHKPVQRSLLKDSLDVIYIGHYEPDGRAEILDYLIKNKVHVRVFGKHWGEAQKKYLSLADMDIRQVSGEEYASLLSAAKIGLVFLSRKNRDVYTRRCFEIPACETLMIAPRTRELEQLFSNGREAVYYDSKEDLLQKIRYYLVHDEERSNIAQSGRQRCLNDGHDEISRARQLIQLIENLRKSS